MAHLPELAQCLESHPRNLLSMMKLLAVIYQKNVFVLSRHVEVDRKPNIKYL